MRWRESRLIYESRCTPSGRCLNLDRIRATNPNAQRERPAPGIENRSCETRSRDQIKHNMRHFRVFSRTPIFNSHHNSKIRKNTAHATTARQCTNAPPHAHTHHRRAARSHVCRHVCSNMQAAHMKPARKAGDCTAHRRGIASRGSRGRRIAGPSPCTELPAKSLREREGGERSSEEGCCCEGGR